MAKIRVYQLAKELSVENAELIDKLKSLGFEVKNHMSTLSEGEVDRVRSDYTKTEEVKVDEIRIKPGIIRRRKKAAEVPEEVEAAEEVAAEAEEAPAVPLPRPARGRKCRRPACWGTGETGRHRTPGGRGGNTRGRCPGRSGSGGAGSGPSARERERSAAAGKRTSRPRRS